MATSEVKNTSWDKQAGVNPILNILMQTKSPGDGQPAPSTEAILAYIAAERSERPKLDVPIEQLPIEHQALIFEAIYSSSVSGAQSSIRLQIQEQGKGDQLVLSEMNKTNYDLMNTRRKQAESRSRSWISRIVYSTVGALTSLPGIGPAIGSVVSRIAMRHSLASPTNVGLAFVVLSSALKPLLDLAMVSAGKEGEFSDLLGGNEWAAALVTFDVGALMGMGVKQLTSNKDEQSAAMGVGAFLGVAFSVVASTVVGPGGAGKGSAEGSLITKSTAAAGFVIQITNSANGIYAGHETTVQAGLQKDQSNFEATIVEAQSQLKSNEERTESRMSALSDLAELDRNCFNFVVEVVSNVFKSLSIPLGYGRESRQNMA